MRFEWDSKREFCSIGEILIKEAFSDTNFCYISFYVSQLWWKFTGMENLAICLFLLFLFCFVVSRFPIISFFLSCILFYFSSLLRLFFIFSSFHFQCLCFISFIEWKCKQMRKFCGVENVRRARRQKKQKTVEISGNLEVEFFCFIFLKTLSFLTSNIKICGSF